MQLRDAINYYFEAVEDEIAAATIRTYKEATKSFLLFAGNVPISTIKPATVRNWGKQLKSKTTLYEDHPQRRELEKEYSVFTIRRLMTSLRTVFNWFVADEIIAKSPFTKTVKIPSRPHPRERKVKAISNSDYYAILRVASEGLCTNQNIADELIKRNLAILTYLRSTGGRVGGLCGLTKDNVKDDGNTISCNVLEKGRNGGTWHTRHLSPGASVAMREWLNVWRGQTRVFYTLTGKYAYKQISVSAVGAMIFRLAKNASVTGKHNPHSFRHSFAIESIKNGTELSVVSQLLGHSTPVITYEVYGQLQDDDLKEQHRRATASWSDRGLVQ